jgi:hypothetical protein
MKAPTRIRDMASGELRYRWIESGRQDHFRHAHVYDHIAAIKALAQVEAVCVSLDNTSGLFAEYGNWAERKKRGLFLG